MGNNQQRQDKWHDMTQNKTQYTDIEHQQSSLYQLYQQQNVIHQVEPCPVSAPTPTTLGSQILGLQDMARPASLLCPSPWDGHSVIASNETITVTNNFNKYKNKNKDKNNL